jgi:regulator of cell morphogenesis and NO signaling
METLIEKTIGELVKEDFRTAAVFSSFKIDFCCKGDRTLDEVCNQKGIAKQLVLEKLSEVKLSDAQAIDFNSWPLDLIVEYIEKKHHRYVEEKTPVLLQYLKKLCAVHGNLHPELIEIERIFSESASHLAAHMKKEELVLFPFIRKMTKVITNNAEFEMPHFGTIENPIRMMMNEHNAEGDNFRVIAELSNNYIPPADACNTFKVTYKMLEEFEKDLHTHIHVENNILFPAAIELEQKLSHRSV